MTAGRPSDTAPARVGRSFTILTNVVLLCTSAFVLWTYLRQPEPQVPQPPPIPSGPIQVDPDARLGSKLAPVVLVEFADFNCPDCRSFARNVLPAIKLAYVSTSQVEIMFMHFPVSPPGLEPTKTALCADEQEAFWSMHDKLFEFPAQFRPEREKLVSEIGLNSEVFDKCIVQLQDLEPARFHEWGFRLKLTAAPSFFVGHRLADGRIAVLETFVGDQPLASFDRVIEASLERAGASPPS